MKLFRSAVMTSATALAVMCFGSAQAGIGDVSEPQTQVVKYNELNLTTSDGATALYGRLRTAAKMVCINLDGRELKQHAMYRDCFDHALSDAVVHVNREAVTALHQRAMRNERAS